MYSWQYQDSQFRLRFFEFRRASGLGCKVRECSGVMELQWWSWLDHMAVSQKRDALAKLRDLFGL